MQRLELTWIGKEEELGVEPRILIHDSTMDYGESETGNMLIHGDNLLALKALEQEYAGRIKCIYIDPPYNIDASTEYYDDNLPHSTWLSLMRARLQCLRNLLSPEGSIWIQIDDEEQAYLKVLCDEVFGRANFINMISVNMKNVAGASGGGEDKRLKKNCEYILAYAKEYSLLPLFNGPYEYIELSELIQSYIDNGKSWKYTSVLLDPGEKQYVGSTVDGQGNEIKVYRRISPQILSVKQVAKRDGITEKEAYKRYGLRVFQTTNAQSSIRTRVMDYRQEAGITDDLISIEYIPITGRNKGSVYEQFYKGDKCRLFVWLRDTAEEIDGELYKKNLQGTYWDMNAWMKNVAKEGGGVDFPNGKKPEHLISQILSMTTEPGDIVLDSFLGSGTTAAVAHKMGRQYIGIELGDHCYSHCRPRLIRVIEGDQTGISSEINWKGGGGFEFFELAPSLIETDSHGNAIISREFNAEMLVAAVAKINGFTYEPDSDVYWKQGYSQDNSYIYVTTQYLTAEVLDGVAVDMSPMESLLVCAPAFDLGLNKRYDNIVVKKIPQSILNKCEYGVDNYNLNIIDLPVCDEEEWGDD